MKQERLTGVIFAAVDVILIIVCAVLYLRTDRTAPEIEFYASDAVYAEGEDSTVLLAGVGAHDNVDGDLTDLVVIEKIIEDRERNSVVVYYAVSDRSGNATKASRVFDAVYMEENREEAERFPKAGIDAEINLYDAMRTIERNEEAKEAGKTESPEPAVAGTTESPEPIPGGTPEKTEEPAAEPSPVPEPTPRPVPTADPSIPILTLKVSEVRVKPGQGPAWVDIIGVLSDDRDSYETLFRNLSVSRYDRDKPGSYDVNVYTEDSDGNRSQSVPLTIIVE